MTIAKDDVSAGGTMVVRSVWVIFLGRGARASVIGVIDDPNIRGTGLLANEVVFRSSLYRAVDF